MTIEGVLTETIVLGNPDVESERAKTACRIRHAADFAYRSCSRRCLATALLQRA